GGGGAVGGGGPAPPLAAARAEAYRILDGVELGGGHFRRDIGLAAEEGHISIPG
ncbi:MAG: phosphoribosylamine--glycine ligase, partial [Dietzia cercidiphylli]